MFKRHCSIAHSAMLLEIKISQFQVHVLSVDHNVQTSVRLKCFGRTLKELRIKWMPANLSVKNSVLKCHGLPVSCPSHPLLSLLFTFCLCVLPLLTVHLRLTNSPVGKQTVICLLFKLGEFPHSWLMCEVFMLGLFSLVWVLLRESFPQKEKYLWICKYWRPCYSHIILLLLFNYTLNKCTATQWSRTAGTVCVAHIKKSKPELTLK